MKKKRKSIGLLAFLIVVLSVCTRSQGAQEPKAVINDPAAAARLEGEHFLALQWISWDYYGNATITRDDHGHWKITGRQDSRENDDSLTIEGIITEINTLSFKFSGKIVTKVSHHNNGKPAIRSGDMTFRISGKRRYWRLKEMQNPDDNVVDYIDIFFKKYERTKEAQQTSAGDSSTRADAGLGTPEK